MVAAMTYEDFQTAINEAFQNLKLPAPSYETDNDGQIILYTGFVDIDGNISELDA